MGMSYRPWAVTFELSAGCRDIAIRCMDVLMKDYRYNYTVAESFSLVLPRWLDRDQMKDMARSD